MSNTPTTNLALLKPAGNDPDWDIPTNSNWDMLDKLLRGVIFGLTLSTAGSTATFGCTAGCASGMVLPSAYTKTLASWAVGSGNGSLDTGTSGGAANTWYHVWLIQRSDTGVVDLLCSLSATAPTMPANYDRKRRIGAMLTDGSKQWVRFFQDGDNFRWAAPVNDYSPIDLTSYTASDYTATARVPTGLRIRALLNGHSQSNTGQPTFSVRATDETYTAASVQGFGFANPTQASLSTRANGVMTNTSGQYYVRATASGGAFYYLYIGTLGWIDRRGQDEP